MLSLYRPGDSVLHRLPAAAKLGGLLLFGAALFLTRDPTALAAAALFGSALLLLTRPRAGALARQLWPMLLILGFLVVANALLVSPAEALVVGLRLLALVAAATAVTHATRPSDIIATLEQACSPFGPAGRRLAFQLGLSIALVLRFAPEVLYRARRIREAAAARGGRATPLQVVVPLAVRLLQAADEVAAALDARGYPPQDPRGGDRDQVESPDRVNML